MDADALVETVREENNTALSRLGSSKSIYADTSGEMKPATVLAAAATRTSHAADLFDDWAETAGGGVATLCGDAADTVGGHADDLSGRVDDFEPGERPAEVEHLSTLDGDPERAGGLLGWALVMDQKTTQLTGYFTGQADPKTAGVFRAFGGDYESLVEATGSALETVCETQGEWQAATDAATEVIQAAYDEYVQRLEALGVNPKPVC